MSNERTTPEKDALVARTYQALARERVPGHLDEKVLRMAARETRTRYSATRAWITPLAWAATIGLCLAIVVDISQVPPPATAPWNPAELDGDSARRDDSGAIRGASSRTEDARFELAGEATADESAAPANRQNVPSAEAAFAPREMTVLQEAADMARAQAGPNQPAVDTQSARTAAAADVPADGHTVTEPAEPQPAVSGDSREAGRAAALRSATVAGERRGKDGNALVTASRPAVAEATWPESDRPCPAATRETARSWLACIAELRAGGLDTLADYEAREFERAHPDYRRPAADK